MPWCTLRLGRFEVGRHAGPPPSYRLAWLRILWRDWDAWSAWAEAEMARYQRALNAARKELRK